MKKLFFNSFTFVLVVTLAAILSSCKSDDNPVTNTEVTYDANTINGTITFVDTAKFISDTSSGAYFVAVFANWPGQPSAYVKITPKLANGKYTATYKVPVTADGNYVVSTAWIKYNPYYSLILGVYDVAGKDTSRASLLGSHPTANISSGKGVGNINYNAYLDTAYKLAKF